MEGSYRMPTPLVPFDEAFETAANGLADSLSTGLSQAVSEALADPIVQALMAADGVDREGMKALLRSTAARLATRKPTAECRCTW
jgi:hypothetical protein